MEQFLEIAPCRLLLGLSDRWGLVALIRREGGIAEAIGGGSSSGIGIGNGIGNGDGIGEAKMVFKFFIDTKRLPFKVTGRRKAFYLYI